MDYLATGILKSSHGLHGYMKIFTFSGEYQHLIGIPEVSLRKAQKEKRLTVQDIMLNGADILIKFTGIDTPEQARRFSGWEVWIPRQYASALQEGEYYVADIARCVLVVNHQVAAKVVAVVDGAQSLLLEVQSVADGRRYFVPFFDPYIGEVDLEHNEIELLAPWLLA